MSTREFERLCRTAFHEAGHAVAAVQTKAKLKRVTIKQGEGHYGVAEVDITPLPPEKNTKEIQNWILRECLVRCAGPAAERAVSKRWNWVGAEGDFWVVNTIGSFVVGGDPKALKKFREAHLRSAQEWLEKPGVWEAIEAVAEALLQRETLSAAEVKELVRVAA